MYVKICLLNLVSVSLPLFILLVPFLVRRSILSRKIDSTICCRFLYVAGQWLINLFRCRSVRNAYFEKCMNNGPERGIERFEFSQRWNICGKGVRTPGSLQAYWETGAKSTTEPRLNEGIPLPEGAVAYPGKEKEMISYKNHSDFLLIWAGNFYMACCLCKYGY